MKTTLKKLLYYMQGYWELMILAVVFSAVGAVLNVISPTFLSEITNEIQLGLSGTINREVIIWLTILAVVVLFLGFLFGFLQSYLMATVTGRLAEKLRSAISSKIDRMPLAYFDKTTYGDTLSRMTNDVDTLSSALSNSVGAIFSGLVTLVGCLFMMFYTNWIMAISGITATLLGFGLTMVIAQKSRPYFQAQQKELGGLNGQIEEVFSGHTIVKAFNSEKVVAAEFHERNNKLYHNAWKAQFLMGLMMPVMSFVGNFGYLVVCIVGAILVLAGQSSMGTIVAFMMYIRLFSNPLSTLAQAMGTLQPAVAAGERIFDLLDEGEMPPETGKVSDLRKISGNVNFEHVHFGYTPERVIIKDFSAEVKSGQKVAIVGPTGAGKTTLVNLLMGFYELNSGQITLDGVSVASLTRANLHELFGMVLQDTWVFEGTVRENIIYSQEGVSEAALLQVCKDVGLHHFIKTLPNGYDTVLDEKTVLSAGQKQLLTIARAMIENAPVLILDEATSSVDTRTEKIIQNAIDQLTAGRTSFVIAHRLSTIKNADLIFVMKDGDIMETGNHQELLAKGGFYAELYNSQFEQSS